MPRASLHPAPFCSFCRSHTHHASFHSASLCPAQLLTYEPCHVSLSLPALRSASHTAPCSMSPCLPVPALLLTHAPCSASPWSAVPLCFSRMPHASLHPACLFSTLLFSSGACSASPFLAVLHMPHAPLPSLTPCAHRLPLTHAPCLALLCFLVLCCASLT